RPLRAHRDLIKVSREPGTCGGQTTRLGRGRGVRQVRQESSHADSFFVAEDFATDDPYQLVVLLVIQVLEEAVPPRGSACRCRVVLDGEIRFANVGELFLELMRVHNRLQIAPGMSVAGRI